MFRKKKTNNKKNRQSNFAKLSIFQPNKYKFKSLIITVEKHKDAKQIYGNAVVRVPQFSIPKR